MRWRRFATWSLHRVTDCNTVSELAHLLQFLDEHKAKAEMDEGSR